MKKMFLIIMALSAFAVGAADVFSSNTFAVTEVTSSATNTIIAIPWTGYTPDGSQDLDVRVDRLVSPRNLVAGDLLLVPTSEVSYAAWSLVESDAANGAMAWEPIATAELFASNIATNRNPLIKNNDGEASIARGYGMWLIRQDPTKPFYLYGQWAKGGKSVTVEQGTATVPAYTMLADPLLREVDINTDLVWEDVNTADSVVITTDANTTLNCKWDSASRKWYHVELQKITKGSITVSKSVKVYDSGMTVPAGAGFWYVSRGGAPTVTFADK